MSVNPALFKHMTTEVEIEPYVGTSRANVRQYGAAEKFLGKLTFEEKEMPSSGDDKRISTARFTMRDYVDVDSRSRVTFPNEELDSPRIMAVRKLTGVGGGQSHTVLMF